MKDSRACEWDKTKSLKNQNERGFGFDIIIDADWDFALEVEQVRDGDP